MLTFPYFECVTLCWRGSGATCRTATRARASGVSSDFVCVCPPGVKGRLCEHDSRDDCRGQPCKNGGVCFDKPGGFECNCPHGFRGITCEIKLFKDPCDRQPCMNGGHCQVLHFCILTFLLLLSFHSKGLYGSRLLAKFHTCINHFILAITKKLYYVRLELL